MPKITVLAHKFAASPEAGEIDPDAASSVDLADALTDAHPTDAHFTAYEPVEIPVAFPDGRTEPRPVRLTYDALDHGITTRMVALVGDLDDPIAHAEHRPASEEWRAEVEPKLEATGHQWYRTKGGARIIAPLNEPFEIASRADADAWTELHSGWVAHMATQGLELDPACKDWTRLYRLPNVVRDGEPTRNPVQGKGRPWRDSDWVMPPAAAPKTRAAHKTSSDKLDKALILADRLPPSIDGAGGDEALFKAANEIATLLGDDADAIETALEFFNQRCLPPWDDRKIRREAERAAERQSGGVAQWLRRRNESATPVAAAPAGQSDDDGLGRELSWLEEEPPLNYYCEGLRLAPSLGKISMIAGDPGGGKGPLSNHLAICFAFGLKAFEALPCQERKVLVLDCEGARLTKRRMERMCRALGVSPKTLLGRVILRDASTVDLVSPVAIEALKRDLDERGIDVVILDSYTSAMLMSGAEANSPEYAILAKLLGSLNRLVIAIGHANKSAAQRGGRPRLSDVAYSGAFAAMAQTAILVHYPDPDQRNNVAVSCARAPEEGFAEFQVQFSGSKDQPLHVKQITAEDAAAMAQQRADETLTMRATKLLITLSDPSGHTIKDLSQATAIPDGIVRHVLESLRTAQVVTPRGARWVPSNWPLGKPPRVVAVDGKLAVADDDTEERLPGF